jgi:prefoldin subunit 5
MDLFEAIQKLYAEKESLMRAISALEALHDSTKANTSEVRRSKRGRKSMNSEERQEVSLRMKKYWATRRVSNGDEMRR